MIITLVRIYKFYFAYVTLILFSIHYKKMETCLYYKYLYVYLHFSRTVGSKGTSPKLYTKLILFILNLAKIYKCTP